MAHAERVLDVAAQNGMLVILCPAYLGYPGSFRASSRARRGGTRKCSPTAPTGAAPGASTWAVASAASRTSSGASAATAIRARPPPASISSRGASAPPEATICSPPTSCPNTHRSTSFPITTGSTSIRPTPTTSSIASCQDDWQRDPVCPFYLIESTYEGEHNASELQIRRQAYWSVLCGGNGHCMGNNPDLAVRRRLGSRARPARLGGDGALGRLLPGAALGRARP